MKAPNWVHSLDGRDKLMDFQNSTFPLAIYGCLDAAIRKLFWLRVWNKNCDPQLIGQWYLEHVMETKVIAAMIRVDKDTETGTMAAIPAFFRRHHTDVTDPVDTILSIMTHMIMLTGENGQTPLPPTHSNTYIHMYTKVVHFKHREGSEEVTMSYCLRNILQFNTTIITRVWNVCHSKLNQQKLYFTQLMFH